MYKKIKNIKKSNFHKNYDTNNKIQNKFKQISFDYNIWKFINQIEFGSKNSNTYNLSENEQNEPQENINKNEKENDNLENNPNSFLLNNSTGVNKYFSFFDRVNQKKLRNKKCYIINHENKFLIIFELLISFFLIYSITFLTFWYAFYSDFFSLSYFIIEVIIDIFFLIDIILNFFISFENSKNVLVVEHYRIVINYLFGWFLIDLISSIPFTLFYHIDWSFLKFLRFPKLLKFLKTIRVFKMFKKLKRLLDKKFRFNKFLENIILYFLFLCIFFHNLSCIFYTIGNYYLNSGYLNNWISENNLLFKPIFDLYLYSLYWSIQTIFTVGYGDFKFNNNKGELIIGIFSMFFGVFIYSFVLKLINKFIFYKFVKNSDYNKIFNNYNNFKKNYKIDKKNKTKLKKYIFNKLNFNLEYNFLKKKLTKKLIYKLEYEMIKDKIHHIFFFNGKSNYFKFKIMKEFKLITFNKNEIIFKNDDKIKYIYFIKKGSVKLSFYNKLKKKYLFLLNYWKNSYFGELEFLYLNSVNKRFTKAISCEKDTLIYKIKIKTFEKLFFEENINIGHLFIKNSNIIKNLVINHLIKNNLFNYRNIIFIECKKLDKKRIKKEREKRYSIFKIINNEQIFEDPLKNLIKMSIIFKNKIDNFLIGNKTCKKIYFKHKSRNSKKFFNFNMNQYNLINNGSNNELSVTFNSLTDLSYLKKLSKFNRPIPEKILKN